MTQKGGNGGGPWLVACEMPWDLDTFHTFGSVCPPPLFLLGHCPAVLGSLERQGKNAPPGGDEPLAETESESEAELAGFSPVVRSRGGGLGENCSALEQPPLQGVGVGSGAGMLPESGLSYPLACGVHPGSPAGGCEENSTGFGHYRLRAVR